MSILLVGVSHRSAPVSVLERVAIADTERPKLNEQLLQSVHVTEAMIVSTCNRIEVYAVVDAFHPALADVGEMLAEHSGMGINELTKHAYVHYSEAAVEHLFAVASGLDSMVVGEQQIIGQIRAAYASADTHRSAGRVLHELAQQALRVGKRVHSETGIDRAGASLVSVALDKAKKHLNDGSLVGRRAAVIGAGAMGSLATSTLVREGIAELIVVNRTKQRAQRLAENAAGVGVESSIADLSDLPEVLSRCDVVVACTGAVGAVVGLADVHLALAHRGEDSPLVLCDLGLPRDIDPSVAGLPGAVLIDMETLQRELSTSAAVGDEEAAREIVAAELADYLSEQRLADVTPTVTALRQRAAEVVEAELMRLESRLPSIDRPERAEIANTVRRVVDKLLHAPTVRVKQLAARPGGDTYAEALRELFELTPGVAQSVSSPMEVAMIDLAEDIELADEAAAGLRRDLSAGEGRGE